MMSDDSKNKMGELLKQAIVSEIDGHKFYDLLAKQTKNDDAKRRLTELRDDEARHRVILNEIYEKIVGEKVGELPADGVSVLTKAFDTDNLKKFNTEIEYINLAMEAELAATQFYKDASNDVDDADMKKLLMTMSDEENRHYEWLMAEREAMAGNYFWFSTDGSSPMEH